MIKNKTKYLIGLLVLCSLLLFSCEKRLTLLYHSDGSFDVFNGSVERVEVDYYMGDDRGTICYQFTPFGRLKESVNHYPKLDTPYVTLITYNDEDSTMVVENRYPDGQCLTSEYRNHYDEDGRLVCTEDPTAACLYSYDQQGNITQVRAEEVNGQELFCGTYHYKYGQMISEKLVAMFLGGLTTNTSYEYDKQGNLIKAVVALPDGEERVTTYADYVTDEHENWTSRRAISDHGTITETRTFHYY